MKTFATLFAVLALAACQTVRPQIADYSDGPLSRKGVLHPVQKGQTLYRIARTYGVPLQELAEVNDLSDPTKIAVGQALWIPGADKVLAVGAPGSTPAPPAPRPKAKPAPVRVAVTTPPAEKSSPPPAPPPKQPAVDPDPDPPPPPPPEDEPKVEVAHSRFIWPVKGVVGSRFGVRDGTQHDGIDIDAPKGTVIVAADAGEVLYVGTQKGYGNLVLVRHADNLITVYAHNETNSVNAGDQVKRGQELGQVGQTGNATGPHCHFEVRQDRVPRNPLFFLP